MTQKQMPIPFVFFESYTNALMSIPDDAREQRAALALAIVEYGALGKEPDFGTNWALASAFALARPNLDSSVKHYLDGKKGGRPKKRTAPSPEALADAMAVCYEPIPDEVLEAQAAYMSDEYERERKELRRMAEAEAWIG